MKKVVALAASCAVALLLVDSAPQIDLEASASQHIVDSQQLLRTPQVSIPAFPAVTQLSGSTRHNISVSVDDIIHPHFGMVRMEMLVSDALPRGGWGHGLFRDDVDWSHVSASRISAKIRIPTDSVEKALGIANLRVFNDNNSSLVGSPERVARIESSSHRQHAQRRKEFSPSATRFALDVLNGYPVLTPLGTDENPVSFPRELLPLDIPVTDFYVHYGSLTIEGYLDRQVIDLAQLAEVWN